MVKIEQPVRQKKTKATKGSTDLKALTKEAEVLFNHVSKELRRLSRKYDTKNMKAKDAIGKGYFFVISRSNVANKKNDMIFSQSNFNFPVAAIVTTLNEVAKKTVQFHLLDLFAQNIAQVFEEKYGEEFGAIISLKIQEFLIDELKKNGKPSTK